MRPRSAKAKGRRAQQQVAETLVKYASDILEADDIRSTPMGVNGPDVLLSPLARKRYPFDIEIKNVEKLNIWEAVQQAKSHGTMEPMVCFTRNGEDMFVALKLETFLKYYNNIEPKK